VPFTQVTLPAPQPCAPSPALPALDPLFAPALSGAVTLVSAQGDARLSATALVQAAWSTDSSHVATLDQSWVTLWRSSDGAAAEHIACPARLLGHLRLAISADLRWIVAPGIVHTANDYQAVVCVVDRAAHAARVFTGDFSGNLSGGVRQPRLEGDILIGVDRSLDLVTGAITLHAPPPAEPVLDDQALAELASDKPELRPPGMEHVDPEGAEQFAVSHDGRYAAGWTRERIILVSGGTDARATTPEPPAFLAVWDLVTGTRLWRDETRCCRGWRFSPDDRFLESQDTHELLRVTSGEVLSFPGTLLPVAPDGQHVLAYEPSGMTLWSLEPRRPIVVVPRPRTIVARSRDGTVSAALDGNQLVLERPGHCIALGVEVRPYDAIAFSPDGRELYAGLDRSGPPPVDPRKRSELDWPTKRTLAVWRTDTGQVANSLSVVGRAAVFPMPAAGQVGFALDNKLAVFDVRTGQLAKAASSAWVSRPPEFAHHLVLGPRSELAQNADDIVETFYGPVTAFATARHPHGRAPLALAPDERHIAATGRDGAILLWDRDRKPIPVAAPRTGEIEVLAFSPDGHLLATAGEDGMVILTEAASGATLGTIALAGDRATFLWWSSDSARLVIDTARRFRITVAPRPGKLRTELLRTGWLPYDG